MRTAAEPSMERSLTVGILQQNDATANENNPIILFENPVEVSPTILQQEGGTNIANKRS
jgi:hypothetical protein